MGGTWSIPRTQRILIGDLSTLPATERRLYQLSQYVLDQSNPNIGTVSTKLGFKIIDIEAKKVPESVSARDTVDNGNVHMKSEIMESREVSCSANVDSESERRESRDVSCNGINVETEDGGLSLFHLLVTNKPYYFSQTFSQWLTLYRYSIFLPLPCCRRDKRIVYLQPVDNFPDFITEFEENMKSYGTSFDFFSLLKTFTEIFFDGMTVNLLPVFSIMQSKWKITTRLHHKTGKKQYFVRDFYNSLQRITPSDGYGIMGISWTDLYPTEDLNFVLGEASFATKSGIFCFGRYEPKTYDPETHKDITELDGKIFWRILKVLSHETCHLFGLEHCWYFQCAMNESTSMVEAASQPLFLCPVCLRKLQYVCKFDVLVRYKKILRFLTDVCVFYPTSDFKRSVSWLENCIKFLEM